MAEAECGGEQTRWHTVCRIHHRIVWVSSTRRARPVFSFFLLESNDWSPLQWPFVGKSGSALNSNNALSAVRRWNSKERGLTPTVLGAVSERWKVSGSLSKTRKRKKFTHWAKRCECHQYICVLFCIIIDKLRKFSVYFCWSFYEEREGESDWCLPPSLRSQKEFKSQIASLLISLCVKRPSDVVGRKTRLLTMVSGRVIKECQNQRETLQGTHLVAFKLELSCSNSLAISSSNRSNL